MNNLKAQPLLSKEKVSDVLIKVKKLQDKVGYSGDYKTWININLPLRIENME